MIEQYRRFKQPVPDELIPPKLSDVELIYWEAFRELNSERTTGMAQGQIPRRAIMAYARECIGSDTVAFAEIIRAMDDAYLSVVTSAGKSDKKFSREKMRGK